MHAITHAYKYTYALLRVGCGSVGRLLLLNIRGVQVPVGAGVGGGEDLHLADPGQRPQHRGQEARGALHFQAASPRRRRTRHRWRGLLLLLLLLRLPDPVLHGHVHQPLDAEGLGGLHEGHQLLLRDADLAAVHVAHQQLQHQLVLQSASSDMLMEAVSIRAGNQHSRRVKFHNQGADP